MRFGTVKQDLSRPPEMRKDPQTTRERIAAATNLYEKNYDEYGRPITKKGQAMSRMYGNSYWEEYPYTINGLLKWFRKLKEALKTTKQKNLESQIQNLSDEVMKLRRKVGDLEDAVYIEDDE